MASCCANYNLSKTHHNLFNTSFYPSSYNVVVFSKSKFIIKCTKENSSNKSGSGSGSGNIKRAQIKALDIILRREAAKATLEKKKHEKLSRKLLPRTVLEALNERIIHKNWESALKVFEIMKLQLWYRPNPRMYTKLLVMLGKCGLYERAQALFEEMIEEGMDPSVESYTALVSAYSRSGLFEKAFSILQKMKRTPYCKPDVMTYSILIKSCLELSKFDIVDKLLSDMARSGIKPNTVTYNTILGAYGKVGRLKEMEDIISGMLENEECKPDVWTMNAAMRALGGRGLIEMMENSYTKFQTLGIKPNDKTFNILIYSYGKKRLYDKMTAVIEYMQKNYYSWTTVTYNILIDAFGRAGDVEQMEYVFNLMVSEGIKPDSITLCSLICGYSKVRAQRKIESVLRKLESSDITPDTVFYNAVIDAFAKFGALDEMESVLIQMKEKGCKPDNVSFSTMIKAYLSNGMVDKAKEFEEKLSNVNKQDS